VENELATSGLSVDLKRAATRSDFFKLFQSFHPDIVLSDYVVGRTSGLSLMKAIRKVMPSQPFIFFSWQIHEASVIEALKAGATDYIFKERPGRLTLSIYRALREERERRERDRAQAELEKSEEYFRSLIENATDIIMVLDGKAVIRFASPSVRKLLGYEAADFVGRNLADFIHEEDTENTNFVLTKSRDKKDFSMEFRFRNKEGSWRGLEAIGRSLVTEDGTLRTVINARDITDRILEQEALRESIIRHLRTQGELQKAQQKVIQQERMAAIGQMASGIAHDFSNALMPVLGFSEILLNRPENLKDLEKVRKYIEMINTSARDAMHIVGGLREFYRQKDAVENLQPMNVNKTIEQVVMMTQPKWRDETRAKGLNVKVVTLLEPVPETIGNEGSIREALTNLLFNAVDAMPEGGRIQIATRTEGEEIFFSVTDEGAGMDEQTRQRCFEPFYSTKGKAGTGLGLPMVYGVVRRHGGTIDLKSSPGKGSSFQIRLPIKRSEAAEKTVAKPPAGIVARKMRILIVDDAAVVRDVLSDYLSGDGHSTAAACDGREALEVFKKEKFDFVITDRAMPEMNGDQLAVAVKKISPATPVVMLTGFGELMKAKGERPEGVDHLLSKPITLELCRETLAKVSAALPALP